MINRPWIDRPRINRMGGRLGLVALLCLAVAACSSPATRTTESPEVVERSANAEQPQEPEPPVAVSHGLGEEAEIRVLDDPDELMEQARTAPNYEVPGLLIRAANEYMDRGDYDSARVAAQRLATYPLTPSERDRLNLVRARLAVQENQPAFALNLLDSIRLDDFTDAEVRTEVLQVRSEVQLSLGRDSDAARTLLELDPLLDGAARENNQRRILALLQAMNPLQLDLLKETSRSPDLAGWISLAEVLAGTDSEFREADIANWRRVYPGHPAVPGVINPQQVAITLENYRQIAVLLPLTSNFGSAAQAFYDGFNTAYNRDRTFPRPQVMLYDTGAEPGLSGLYYRAAIADGADFVVGPLGKAAVDSLLASEIMVTDTLVLADIPPGREADNLFSLSLSPEAEARQLAERAWNDGHRQVSVLRIANDWGSRVANAFSLHWESLGGVVVKNSSFPGDISDYTRIMQKYLGLDNSIKRAKLLEAQVGRNLEFTPRRNEDMDFIFLAANAAQARLVVPQLRFFQGHDLPIYATSYVYTGVPEPGADADLDGLVFGEMPWILESVENFRVARAEEAARRAQEEAEALAQAAGDAAGEESADGQDETAGEAQDDIAAAGDSEDGSDPSQTDAGVIGSVIPEAAAGDDLAATDGLSGGPLEDLTPRPYQGSTLDRLYALGVQAYQSIPRLVAMRQDPLAEFQGEAMRISVSGNGAVQRHPVWSSFRSGLVVPLPEPVPGS